MLYCPRCQSPNVVSGKLDDDFMQKAVRAAQAVQVFENKRLSALSGIAARSLKLVDVLRADHHCLDCQSRFDDADCGIARHA